MAKPVTPQDMFDLWQKMVNPGAYPLQSLMFPVLDAKELEKKIAELETVEHWLKANLNMLQLTLKSLEYQRQVVKGGERIRAAMEEGESAASPGGDEVPNPAMWAWNMMAQAGNDAAEAMGRAVEAAGEAAEEAKSRAPAGAPKPKRKTKTRRAR
ncbi:MAG: PhaM family polyhydroxyalkanoate granule multifunctional regulatory protein [Burkholderiales bacterium]